MPALKFVRKLGTTWVFPLTWIDRDGNRQQITGWVNPTAFWRTFTVDTPIDTDVNTGFTVNENPLNVATYGDFTYRRLHTDQAEFPVGVYRLDFEATMNAEVVPAPELNYVIVEVKA